MKADLFAVYQIITVTGMKFWHGTYLILCTVALKEKQKVFER
jgi:hypothetical protein